MFRKTHWALKKDKEAEYVKSVIIIAAIYRNLAQKFGKERALKVMQEVIPARKHLLFTIKDPFERWIKYRSILITEGFGLHNTIEDVYIYKTRMHYIVKRCIFHDVFKETGVPELTLMICDYDQSFHSAMFSEFYFDRNGSWKNTIGHGASLCHYVWKDKNTLAREFKEYLVKQKNEDYVHICNYDGTERRQEMRRQYDRRQFERRQFDRRSTERRKS